MSDDQMFCTNCGTMLPTASQETHCPDCNQQFRELPANDATPTTDSINSESGESLTAVERLPLTDSGSVRKRNAMRWFDSLERPTDEELKNAVTPKPYGFTGSTFPTDISNIRVTGDPGFIETFAGLLKPLLDLENTNFRLEINLKQTTDKETGEPSENYALYLSVAERGGN